MKKIVTSLLLGAFWFAGSARLACSEEPADTQRTIEPRFKYHPYPVSRYATARQHGCDMAIPFEIASMSTPGDGPPKFYDLKREPNRDDQSRLCLYIDKMGVPTLKVGNLAKIKPLVELSEKELLTQCGEGLKDERLRQYKFFGWNGLVWNTYFVDFQLFRDHAKRYRVSGPAITDHDWQVIGKPE